jgi:hypothetical protein
LRPGKGRSGQHCMVKANHFIANLPDKDLHHYDVRNWCSLSLHRLGFLQPFLFQ